MLIEFLSNQTYVNWSTSIATLVTGLATVALVYATLKLVKVTKFMAEQSQRPYVVATLEPNQWSLRHFDMKVTNAGNAVAFDIDINFEPPLENSKKREALAIPFQKVSILRPGQQLVSYLTEYGELKSKQFTISIGWRASPTDRKRETISYLFNFSDYDGLNSLGAINPSIQIAEQVKKIREDWESVAKGRHHIRADIFTSQDRNREAEERAAELEEYRRQTSPE